MSDMKYIASYSGGKDSTATVILAHEHNEPLDLIIFSEVMFDENTSGELPEHIDFIKNKAFPLFEGWGYETKILHSKNTYIDLFYKNVTRSKTESRNGKIRGFPMPKGCHMNSGAKIPPVREYLRNIRGEFVQYIGIAIDATIRMERIVNSGNKVSLLQKYGYTEQMAYDLCKKYDLLSPIYDFAPRGGCWFCPNTRDAELRHLRNCHRDLWDKLIDLSKENCANPYFNSFKKKTIFDFEEIFKNEDQQMTIFDFLGGGGE